MRTKKTWIKDSVITRTVPFTRVKFVSVNLESMQVEEKDVSLIMEYDEKEAENAIREMGYNIAAVKEIYIEEVKLSVDTSDFVKLALSK